MIDNFGTIPKVKAERNWTYAVFGIISSFDWSFSLQTQSWTTNISKCIAISATDASKLIFQAKTQREKRFVDLDALDSFFDGLDNFIDYVDKMWPYETFSVVIKFSVQALYQ